MSLNGVVTIDPVFAALVAQEISNAANACQQDEQVKLSAVGYDGDGATMVVSITTGYIERGWSTIRRNSTRTGGWVS